MLGSPAANKLGDESPTKKTKLEEPEPEVSKQDSMFGALSVSADGELDRKSLSDKLGRGVKSAHIRDFAEKCGGMSCEFNVVAVHFEDGDKASYVLKSASKVHSNVGLGLAREAFFFNELALALGSMLPKAFYAHGDLASGTKVLLMEDLSDMIPAGVFFGPGNPNNWQTDLSAACALAGNPTAEEITRKAFTLFAQLHAQYWGDQEALSKDWLKGSKWFRGEGEATWQFSQNMASGAWAEMCGKEQAGTLKVKLDPHAKACLNEAMKKISWDRFQADVKDAHWTVVQGDCHPHNLLWPKSADSTHLQPRLIDFEMAGIGSGAQDLGQFLISHMEPELRRKCEAQLVTAYHEELQAKLRARSLVAAADSYTFEQCWSEYVQGGAGRWSWFVPYLMKACPPPMGQFFHDQYAAFVQDHIAEPSHIQQPRV